MKRRLQSLIVLLCLSITSFLSLQAQCGSCGDGSEGVFQPIADTTLAGGVHNFSAFTIGAGITVRATGNQALEIKVTGNVDISGTLDVSGVNGSDGVTFASAGIGAIGVAGGGNGGNGAFSANNGPITASPGAGPGGGGQGDGWSGGGGGGYATTGASSGSTSGGFGGVTYGSAQLTGMTAGSGGGGGSGGFNCGAGGGGAGGGFVSIFTCGTLLINGTINANGGNGGSDGTGNCGGGAGGSGGSIWLSSPSIVNNGVVTAIGGIGGASNVSGSPYFGTGADGAIGRIRSDAGALSGTGSFAPIIGFSGGYTIPLSGGITAGADLSCFGSNDGSITAAATSSTSVNYQWSNGATSAQVTGLAAGCYTVTISDSVGCTVVDSACIAAPTALTVGSQFVNAQCFADCNGEAFVVAGGGTPNYSYIWSTGDTTAAINNLCAGTYAATITDANGCSINETITISEPSALVLTMSGVNSNTTTSFDGSATVAPTGGTPGYTYLWTPGGETTQSINNIGPGIYLVTVTDSSGCSDTASIEISVLIAVDPSTAMQLALFPNPTAGSINLQLEQPAPSQLRLEIFDAQGRIVMHQEYLTSASFNESIDLGDLGQGIYYFKVTTDFASTARRITLQR